MKNLICILTLILVGCGKGGSSPVLGAPAPGLPPGLPGTCKSLYSVWNSMTDSEQFDFTSLQGAAVNSTYTYHASDNSVCGQAGLSSQIVQPSGFPTGQYELNLVFSVTPVGACLNYVPPGSIQNRYADAILEMSTCNQLQVCIPYGAGTCKTFQ